MKFAVERSRKMGYNTEKTEMPAWESTGPDERGPGTVKSMDGGFEMEYRKIEGLKKPLSRLLFGTASPAFIRGEDTGKILDAALEAGINGIDTARNYGLSEKSIGDWLRSRGCRDQLIILSKCGHPDASGSRISEKEIRADFARSSELLGTSFIDLYVLHRDDPDVRAGEIVEILNSLHAEGKIGAFGGSNWTYERIREANEYALSHHLIPFTVSSPHYSLARQKEDPWGGGCVTLTGSENRQAREWYRKTGMPVIAYSSLCRGLLSGRIKSTDLDRAAEFMDPPGVKGYVCRDNFERLKRCEELAPEKHCSVAQLAMAWLYHQPENVFAVATMSSPKRIQENVDALSIELTAEECRWLNLED